jgi:hypothetical protein
VVNSLPIRCPDAVECCSRRLPILEKIHPRRKANHRILATNEAQMKLLLTIFAALILAAILGGLYGKVRIDQWENATDACYAQIESDRAAFNLGRFTDWNEARSKETKQYRLLLRLLENKPFGIPLDEEEQDDLNSMRIEVARRGPLAATGPK